MSTRTSWIVCVMTVPVTVVAWCGAVASDTIDSARSSRVITRVAPQVESPTEADGARIVESWTYFLETATSPTSDTGGPTIGGTFQQFIGAKFEVASAVTVTAAGGWFNNGPLPLEIFVAIVPLHPITDLPNTFDLSDAVFSQTFTPPDLAVEWREVVISTGCVTVQAGRYAILFGTELFGSLQTAMAHAPWSDADLGTPEYIVGRNMFSSPEWIEGLYDRYRIFVAGQFGAPIFCDGFESGGTSMWSSS